jgi:hypothetical protein
MRFPSSGSRWRPRGRLFGIGIVALLALVAAIVKIVIVETNR